MMMAMATVVMVGGGRNRRGSGWRDTGREKLGRRAFFLVRSSISVLGL